MSHSSQPQQVQFQNDKIHVFVVHKPFCRIELKVKAYSPLIASARRAALKAVSKEISLPGFRKGRAPESMILKKFSSNVEKETHNTLADAAFAEAQELTKIPLLNNNARVTFDLQNLGEKEADLLFSFETEPTPPPIDFEQCKLLPFDRPPVTDQEIDEAIRQMQFFFAKWETVSHRPIQEKDYLLIDLDTIEGDSVQRIFHSVRFEVSKERMAEWMQKLVIGAKIGDILEGISEPDANATEEENKEFQPKKVRIAILKVEEATLPELDDEFARKVGAKDLIGMRQLVADMLNRQLDVKAEDALREQVNHFLIESSIFEIPQSLITAEKEHRLRQLFQTANFKRDWDKMSQEERKSYEDRLIDESVQALRLFYASRKVVRDANLGITHKEVQDEAVALWRSHGMQKEIHFDQIPKEIYALALSKVILSHAQDHIIKRVSPV